MVGHAGPGSSNLDKKDALIQNLARWARADGASGRGAGVVALMDASEDPAVPYGWMGQISALAVAVDPAIVDVYDNVETRTATGVQIVMWNGLQLGYTNMASGAIVPTGGTVDATGGRSTAAVLVTAAGDAGPGGALATVTTDRQDYAPGETVTVTGTGWEPGETVSMMLHEEPLVHGDRTISAVADADGKIFNNSFHPEEHDLGVRFVLTATGQISGRTAQTTFTDNRTINSVTLDGGASVTVAPGATITVSMVVATTTGAGGGENWFSTQYQIGAAPAVCIDVPNPDIAAVGTFTRTFVIAAPAVAGNYNVAFEAYRTAACGNNASPTFTLTNGIHVVANQPPVANNDSYGVNEDNTLTVATPGALGNDTDTSPTR